MHDVCDHFPQVSEYILALEYPKYSNSRVSRVG